MVTKNNEKGFEGVKTSEELEEELVALKLRIAFAKEFEMELAEAEAQAENPDAELEALLARADDRMMKMFAKEQRKGQVERVVFHYVPKVAHAMVVLIAVCCMGLTAAVATVPPVRAGVLEFIAAMETRFIALDTDDVTVPVQVPEGWTGEYYLTYVPQGYAFEWLDEKHAEYANADGKIFVFKECNHDTNSNLDGEENNLELITVNGNEAFASMKDGWTTIAWSNGHVYFVIYGSCNEDELVQLAESVKKIKN